MTDDVSLSRVADDTARIASLQKKVETLQGELRTVSANNCEMRERLDRISVEATLGRYVPGQWVSADEPPTVKGDYLAWIVLSNGKGGPAPCHYEKVWMTLGDHERVTHWMHLPGSPMTVAADDKPKGWRCKANIATGAGNPQDCTWPLCGCDPHADRVIETLNESGLYVVPSSGDNFELIHAGVEALKGMDRDQPEECVLAVYEAMVERSQKP